MVGTLGLALADEFFANPMQQPPCPSPSPRGGKHAKRGSKAFVDDGGAGAGAGNKKKGGKNLEKKESKEGKFSQLPTGTGDKMD